MIREVIQEIRQIRYEMPAFTAAFLLLVALCIGVRCAIFYEADGEQLRFVADQNGARSDVKTDMEGDPMQRMYARVECPVKIPGVTVIVGLRQYSMELSVPIASFRSLIRDEQRI